MSQFCFFLLCILNQVLYLDGNAQDTIIIKKSFVIDYTKDREARKKAYEEMHITAFDECVDFTVWDKPKYKAANTAANADYLTPEEKKVYYYLNLMRLNPSLFADTYLHHLLNCTDYYPRSLIRDLRQLKKKPLLYPDRKLYESAKCHAIESGERGYHGHDRIHCPEDFTAECCEYGDDDAWRIVMNLLIDEGVSSLGHRYACMTDYDRLGVSIQPHKTSEFNAVLDFGYSSENR